MTYCSICKGNFEDIKSHYETKHGHRKHTCESCFKKFPRPKDLRIHVKTVHSTYRNFFCDFCKKGFAEKFQIKRHMKIHVGNPNSKFKQLDDFKDDFKGNKETFKDLKGEIVQLPKQQKILEQIKSDEESFEDEPAMFDDEPEIQEENFIVFKQEIIDEQESIHEEQISIEPHVKIEEEESNVNEIIKIEYLEDIQKTEFPFLTPSTSNNNTPSTSKSQLSYTCDLCNSVFPLKLLIHRHMMKSHIKDQEDILKDLPKNGKCDECGKKFTRMQHLKQHYLAIHMKHTYNCEECERTFGFKSALYRHRKIVHENKKDYICSECGLKFGSNTCLQQHFKAHHDEASLTGLTCKLCGKSFTKKQSLKSHIEALHHGEKKFQCDICLRSFSFKTARERHIKIVHLNQKSHKCEKCEKTFSTRYDMTNHFNYHHSDGKSGRFGCKECEMVFLSSAALARHKRGVHENIKQKVRSLFKCKICLEALPNKYKKDKHMSQVHFDGKKLMRKCEYCKEEFKLFSAYKEHIETHKSVQICVICGQFFTDLEEFSIHTEDHKKIEKRHKKFICDICDHRVYSKMQLSIHMRKHIVEKDFYVCDICGQGYKYISAFLYHMKIHENKKEFKCSHCSKEFIRKNDLEGHIRTHTNEKPFKCKVCDRGFSTKQPLKIHLQTHLATRPTYPCTDCNITFKDKKYLRVHDGQFHPEKRPFKCHICYASFTFEQMLKKHKTLKHKGDPSNDTIMNALDV